jgi:predicted nucleic acid-binding protein
MFLVVDANVFFSALVSKGKIFKVFMINSFLNLFELVAPEFLKEEIEEHKEEILSKSKLSEQEGSFIKLLQ